MRATSEDNERSISFEIFRPSIICIALEKKNIVRCITPKEKMARYYEITELGKKILRIVKNENK